MRSTVVPAQVTTVEDRIAGSLTFPQVLLLVAALIFGSALFLLLPPRRHMDGGKLYLIVFEAFVLGGLALRFKGRLAAEWLALILRYRLRPRLYVFTKNDLSGRVDYGTPADGEAAAEGRTAEERTPAPSFPGPERERLERILSGSALSLRLAFARKGIDVSLEERRG